MSGLINTIKAANYQLVHSRLLLLHVIVPFLAIFIFCAYYSYSPWQEGDKALAYLQAVALIFPFLIAVTVTMLYERELHAGNFQVMISMPYAKWTSHAGNLASLMGAGFLACFIAGTGFGVIFYAMGNHLVPILFYARAAVLLFLSNLSVYLIQYMVCFSFGNGVSFAAGITGTLLSALLYMGLSD